MPKDNLGITSSAYRPRDQYECSRRNFPAIGRVKPLTNKRCTIEGKAGRMAAADCLGCLTWYSVFAALCFQDTICQWTVSVECPGWWYLPRSPRLFRLTASRSEATDASPKSKVIVPDKVVESAGKAMLSGTDSLTRFPARSHLLVARNLVNTKQRTMKPRVFNPTKY